MDKIIEVEFTNRGYFRIDSKEFNLGFKRYKKENPYCNEFEYAHTLVNLNGNGDRAAENAVEIDFRVIEVSDDF